MPKIWLEAPDPPPLPEIQTRDSIPFTITEIDFTRALCVRHDSTEVNVYIWVRAAKIRTAHGRTDRPITKLVLLEKFL